MTDKKTKAFKIPHCEYINTPQQNYELSYSQNLNIHSFVRKREEFDAVAATNDGKLTVMFDNAQTMNGHRTMVCYE